jgi:hypothetical protein
LIAGKRQVVIIAKKQLRVFGKVGAEVQQASLRQVKPRISKVKRTTTWGSVIFVRVCMNTCNKATELEIVSREIALPVKVPG